MALRLVPLSCLIGVPFLLCRPVFEGMNRGKPGLVMAALRYEQIDQLSLSLDLITADRAHADILITAVVHHQRSALFLKLLDLLRLKVRRRDNAIYLVLPYLVEDRAQITFVIKIEQQHVNIACSQTAAQLRKDFRVVAQI